MELKFIVPFDPEREPDSFFDSFPSRPAVFAVFPVESEVASPPYLGRTRDLRRRLGRLLSPKQKHSRLFSLRGFARRIEWQVVGSTFEGQWLNYLLNKHYYPRQYRARLRLKPPPLLKLNLRNRFPRCYATRRMVKDGSVYYGPFPSQVAAERFAAEFLDFFKIRRCVEELDPDPSHPGCIYSEMKMCLAPCYAGCTDEEYQTEVGRVVEFLDGQGKEVLRSLAEERARASEALEFEQAAKIHARLEKITALVRQKSELARNLHDLHALVMQKGAEEKSVSFFRVWRGELRGPVALSLDENVPSPLPLDRQLHNLLDSLAGDKARLPSRVVQSEALPPAGVEIPAIAELRSGPAAAPVIAERHSAPAAVPPWEHLSLLSRWYYSSFREGELVMLNSERMIPHTRLIRICRKILAVQ
jgi:excinuclease UvrABC nuclease subunit